MANDSFNRFDQLMFGNKTAQRPANRSTTSNQNQNLDFSSIFNNVDQIVNTVNQVKPIIKEISPLLSLFKKG